MSELFIENSAKLSDFKASNTYCIFRLIFIENELEVVEFDEA